MATYIKTVNPNKFVKITLDYSKGYRKDNADRGYRVYLCHVERSYDGFDSHTLYQDSKSLKVLVGIPRRSPKTDAEAKALWAARRIDEVKAFCAEKGISLLPCDTDDSNPESVDVSL